MPTPQEYRFMLQRQIASEVELAKSLGVSMPAVEALMRITIKILNDSERDRLLEFDKQAELFKLIDKLKSQVLAMQMADCNPER